MIEIALRGAAAAALWLGASPALDALVKITLVLAAGLVAARLTAHGRASVRHAMLAAALIAAAAVPVMMAVVPPLEVSIEQDALTGRTVSVQSEMPGPAEAGPHNMDPDRGSAIVVGPGFSPADAIGPIWALGVLLATAPLAFSLWRLRTLRRRGLPSPHAQALVAELAPAAGVSRRVVVATDAAVPAPLTFGVVTPVIVLPESACEWDAAALRRALIHELAHIHRGDWWTHVAGRFVCACYWFHPLAWRAYRQLAVEAERACDDEVLAGEDRAPYADQLVALARRMSASTVAPLVGMANRSDLATRVAAVLDDRQPRGRMGPVQLGTVALLTLVGLVTIAPVRGVARAAAIEAVASAPPEAQRPARRGLRLDRALVEAAADGDLDGVASMLNAGADVNAAVDGDGSPLIAAARAGDRALVTFLLDRGADVNLAVEGDGNPLIIAAAEGHLAIVELLLARGADVNGIVASDENALIQASGGGHLAVARLLIARGADVNARIWAENNRGEGEWRTALWAAQRGKHREVMDYLLSAGATQ